MNAQRKSHILNRFYVGAVSLTLMISACSSGEKGTLSGAREMETMRLYQSLKGTLLSPSGIDAKSWFVSPFVNDSKKRVTKTENFVDGVLRLKQADPELYAKLREIALQKANALPQTRNPETNEPLPYVLFLKLVFEDEATWVSYVKEKSGYDAVKEGKDPYLQGTPDRRFQDSMAPLLIQLDRSIVDAIMPYFPSVYPDANKKYVLRPQPGERSQDVRWKSSGQGPKRLMDSFVRYTQMPEYAFMGTFMSQKEQFVAGGMEAALAHERAAGEAYEEYLKETRKVSGFDYPAGSLRGVSGVGLEQADYNAEVLAEVVFTIQKQIQKSNRGHQEPYEAIHILGGSLPRGTATLSSSDIDSLIKLRNGKYLGLVDRARGEALAGAITQAIRANLRDKYDPAVDYNLEVADDKMSSHRFVQKLNEFDLSKINPMLLEVGESHVCLIIHNYSKKTTSNQEIQKPGVMVFPIQSWFHRQLGQPEVVNQKPCATRRRSPG